MRRATLAQNPVGSHYVDIKGDGAGQVAGSGGFNHIGLGTRVSDTESLWDTSNYWYTVPENGLYLLTASVRPADSSGGFEFGHGLDTADQDSLYFKWDYRPGVTRWVSQYAVLRALTTGQQIRYVVFGLSQAISTCAVRIFMLRTGTL